MGRFASFALTIVVASICFELFLHASGISLPSYVANDPKLGRTYRPDASILFVREGFYMGAVNSYGYLGPGYPPERDRSGIRVAVIGDSYVQAFQLFDRHNFHTVLKRELSERTGQSVEVLNFGRSDQDLRTMYIYYKEAAEQYRPDIIVLVLGASNLYEKDENLGPYCSLGAGGLMIDYGFAQSAAYRRKEKAQVIRRFGSFQLLQRAYSLFRHGETPRILFDKFYELLTPETDAANGAAERANDRFFELNKAVIEELTRIDSSGGARVVIATRNQLPSYYDPVLRASGLTVFDLHRELTELEETGFDPHYWPATGRTGHWNHEGHKLVGMYLAENLEALVHTDFGM